MQLRQLEEQLSKLHAIRRTIVGEEVVPVGHARGRYRDASARRWFVAGAAIALTLLFLAVCAWVARGEVTVTAAPKAALLAAPR